MTKNEVQQMTAKLIDHVHQHLPSASVIGQPAPVRRDWSAEVAAALATYPTVAIQDMALSKLRIFCAANGLPTEDGFLKAFRSAAIKRALQEETLEIAEPASLPESSLTWREVWRKGIAPQLSTAGLVALAAALRANDSRLIQGQTYRNVGQRVECACAITFTAWQGENQATVEEVERFFARTCYTADSIMNETACVRHWFAFYDETDRPEMLAALLPEVELALAGRSPAAA